MDEIIAALNENNVRYLLIGGQALRLLGMPRFSMDWDLLLPGKDLKNVEKINQVLSEHLDLPLEPLGPRGENFVQTYQTRFGVLQFHLAPVGLPKFDEVERSGVVIENENGVPVKCLSPVNLLECKKRTGRGKDVDDVLFLSELLRVEKNGREKR